MKLSDLKATLGLHPRAFPRFILPNGDQIAAHFHITEIGHMAKRFIDCGGKLHDTINTCLVQTHIGGDVDHRLTAAAFAKILMLGGRVLPHDDVEVEVEYEHCTIIQSPIKTARVRGEYIELQLGEKHTDCLAKQKCGTSTAALACC
jgi:hypothetical protein